MFKKVKIETNLITLIVILIAAILLTVPVLSKIPLHPDEHQFYLNAFSIMGGKELHNYLHVALTEYFLAGFYLIVNVFTNSGVNFPQGEPTAATYYYGHVWGAILYFLAFLFGALIIQKRESKLKIRTIFFAILYFGSVAMFERFIRINSDSFMIIVFLNFLIISLWQHLHKPSLIEMFILNALFIFLGTFTNLKSLFMFLPLVVINTLAPILWYEKKRKLYKEDLTLSQIYRIFLYIVGIIAICIFLWSWLIPKPFSVIKFWYTLKNTIVQGTTFDFNYPTVAFKSWLVYLYDLLVYQIGLYPLLCVIAFFVISIIKKKKTLFAHFWLRIKEQLDLTNIKEGKLYKSTELLIFISFIFYYFGISMRVIHWSRWGAPLGFLTIVLLSFLLEMIFEFVFTNLEKAQQYLLAFLPVLLFVVWGLRIALTVDLYRSNYSIVDSFPLTIVDIKDFLKEKNISLADAQKKVAWFTGYTANVNNLSFELVAEKKNWETQYLLWPAWNAGLLYSKRNVDRSTSNQRAFVDKYVDDIEYRFPTFLSKYMHETKYFAWHYLGITWIPESDSLVETYYAALKLKSPVKSIELNYTVPFKDLSHYKSNYSPIFNSLTLQDTYVFPPCYSYAPVRKVSNGDWVRFAPPELGIYGKTAGLYCHSLRLRVIPKGVYAIKINGLPEDPENTQVVYYNLGEFSWDPKERVVTFALSDTIITGEFGVATKEQKLPLTFEVYYVLNQDILTKIDEAKQSSGTNSQN